MKQRFNNVKFLGDYSFLKKQTQEKFMSTISQYNSFGEDRTSVLDTLFHPNIKRPLIHLGNDIFKHENSLVVSNVDGTVVNIYTDKSEFCGWGTRITIANNEKMYLFGHLKKVDVVLGQYVSINNVLGVVGEYENNGGWFEHVHIQCCDKNWYYHYNQETIPGYATSTVCHYNIFNLDSSFK